MTYEQARTAILARSEIRITADKNGRRVSHYYSKLARRWIKIGNAEADLALAAKEAA